MSLGADLATLAALAVDNRSTIEKLVRQLVEAVTSGGRVRITVDRARDLDDSLSGPPTERNPLANDGKDTP